MTLSFTGYHTCSNTGGLNHVMSKAPFPATNEPMVGQGSYFWDDNKVAAREWGYEHYNGRFYILKFDIVVESSKYLDLVGCAEDQRLFKEYRNTALRRGYAVDGPVGRLVDWLVEEDENIGDFFPFRVFRFEAPPKPRSENTALRYSSVNPWPYRLSPRLALCVRVGEGVTLSQPLNEPHS